MKNRIFFGGMLAAILAVALTKRDNASFCE